LPIYIFAYLLLDFFGFLKPKNFQFLIFKNEQNIKPLKNGNKINVKKIMPKKFVTSKPITHLIQSDNLFFNFFKIKN
jgi:hypothetical protein